MLSLTQGFQHIMHSVICLSFKLSSLTATMSRSWNSPGKNAGTYIYLNEMPAILSSFHTKDCKIGLNLECNRDEILDHRGFKGHPCCMTGIMKMFCTWKNIFPKEKEFILPAIQHGCCTKPLVIITNNIHLTRSRQLHSLPVSIPQKYIILIPPRDLVSASNKNISYFKCFTEKFPNLNWYLGTELN